MLKQLVLACLVVLACVVCCTEATSWKACGSSGHTVRFTVEGCEGRRFCKVQRGKSYWVMMQFRGKAPAESLTASVIGKSRGMSSPMPLASRNFDSNACDYMTRGCPVRTGEMHTYRYPLFIESFFPPSFYRIQYGLRDEAGRTQGCARLVIRVQ